MYILHIQTFDKHLLNQFLAILREKAKLFSFTFQNTVSLPKKTRKFVVLRSPHVHIRSREQFYLHTYRRRIQICKFDKNFLKFLILVLIPGINIKLEIK